MYKEIHFEIALFKWSKGEDKSIDFFIEKIFRFDFLILFLIL